MTSSNPPPLRRLPAVHELLALPEVAELIDMQGRETVRAWIRDALDDLRREIHVGAATGDSSPEGLRRRVLRETAARGESDGALRLGPVINATGVVLHTSLGRAPLSSTATHAVREVAGSCNLEVNLATGARHVRGEQLQTAWRRLTGAEASLVVNNNAAATVLVLDALCRGREVLLSRGQLIEIGGSFRLPEIFAQSGAVLREIGTTNRTRLADYANAITPATAAILRVHPSNYRVVGFADTPDIGELSQLARQHGLLCIDDIGSGCLVETRCFGLPHEPTFVESLRAGADLVLGSGDKLLGGPQSGILLGRAELIARLRSHPLARAFRVDKLTLAALTATLDAYLRGTAETEIPTLAMLGASARSLHERAEQIQFTLRPPPVSQRGSGGGALRTTATPVESDDTPGGLRITVACDTAPVGGGSLPGATLPTAALHVRHSTRSADELARRLRLGPPRVFGRIQDGAVVLDLRSVLPEDDERILLALQNLIAEGVE